MKLMFVLDNIDERCGANVNIILNLLKLWKKDNEIHLLVQHGEISQIDQQKERLFEKVIKFKHGELDYIEKTKTEIPWKEAGLLKRLLLLITHPIFLLNLIDFNCFGSVLSVNKYKKSIEQQCKYESYDAIIGVAAPYYLQRAVAKANVNSKKISIQLDPYTNNYTERRFLKGYRKTVEKATIKKLDYLFAATFVYEDIKKWYTSKDLNSIISFELPGIIVEDVNNNSDYSAFDKKEDNLHFAYVGVFYEEIRNPELMLKFFSMLPDNCILDIYGGGTEDILQKYKKQLGDRLVLHGWVDSKTARKSLFEADFLINLNNSISNQMPSKFFDYIGTGKPFINFCWNNSCPSLNYTDKYPYVLNVVFSDENYSGYVERVNEFISAYRNTKVDKSIILDNFRYCTDEYVANMILTKIYEICKCN